MSNNDKNKSFTPLRNRRFLTGFTLIELLVVIAIIGLLSSITLVSINSVRAKARDAKRVTDMDAIRKAMELYAADNNGQYYGEGGVCDQTVQGVWSGGIQAALSPYLSKLPIDPLNAQANSEHYYQLCRNNFGEDLITGDSLPANGTCGDKLVLAIWDTTSSSSFETGSNHPGFRHECTSNPVDGGWVNLPNIYAQIIGE